MSKVYKKKDVDENVYDLAIKRINRTFDIFDTVAVMFSGGKREKKTATRCFLF